MRRTAKAADVGRPGLTNIPQKREMVHRDADGPT